MKKDTKPLWIFLAITFGLQIIIGFALGIMYGNESLTVINKSAALITFICDLLIAIIFILIYHNFLKDSTKKITRKDLIIIFVGAILLIAANEVASRLLIYFNVEMANQETILESFKENGLLTFISVVILAPFIEEMAFRYSISTFIKNDYLFVIISSVLFGVLHGIGIVTSLYILLGAGLAIIYLMTNRNILSTIIVHVLNNAFAVITMMILIK